MDLRKDNRKKQVDSVPQTLYNLHIGNNTKGTVMKLSTKAYQSMLINTVLAGKITPRKAKTLAMAAAVALTPALANAGNTTTQLYNQELFDTVKHRIDGEIGETWAVSKIFNCGYTRCEKRVAEWYYPERNLYVRLTGGVGASTLTVGTVCEAGVRCALLADLSE